MTLARAGRGFALCAALAAPLGAQDASTAPLDRAVKAYAALTSVHAAFEQTLTNPNTRTARTSKGDLYQRGRNRFALRFTDPAGDAIVGDGQAVWVYLPSTAKGQVMKLPPQAGAVLDVVTQLLAAPRTHYDVTVRPDTTIGGRKTAVFALTPKNPAAPFTRATLWIGREDALLWQLEAVEPSGLIRRIRFTAIHPGAEFSASLVSFTVPTGVRIVDQAAMLGGKP